MLSRMHLKRRWFVVAAALVVPICAGTPLSGQEAAALKIGVFNADRIMADTRPGQQALALFNQLREQRVGELQVQQDQINGLRQQALAAIPGSPESAQLQRQMEDRMLQMDRLEQDVQQELGLRQNELTAGITEMVAAIIETVGGEGGYTMIFNSLQSGLVYIDPTIDITDEIVRRVDEASPAEPF